MIPITFQVPKYELGAQVFHKFNTSRGEFTESGTILGYSWSPDGQLEMYNFAPDSNKSVNYPCQTVGVESVFGEELKTTKEIAVAFRENYFRAVSPEVD